MTPGKLAIMLVVVIAAIAGPVSRAQAVDADRATKIKAGMVLNFIRYTEWPESAFDSAESPIVVTTLGESEINSDLEQTLGGQQAHGRAVSLRRIHYPEPLPGESIVSEARLADFLEQLRSSHVLFVGDSERDRLAGILRDMGKSDVLTVSDMPEFAEHGGMLGLTIRRDRIAVDANTGEIQNTQLKVSSQLLRLARTVKSR